MVQTLGINKDGNNWKYVTANFLIVLAMTVTAELSLKLVSGTYPTGFEIYECGLKAFGAAIGATALILGINKATHGD